MGIDYQWIFCIILLLMIIMISSMITQVDRYKQLLLKQRDIMIALTQRLVERDEQIMSLQVQEIQYIVIQYICNTVYSILH